MSEPAGAQELLVVMSDHCCICLSARCKKSGVFELPLKRVFKESPGSFEEKGNRNESQSLCLVLCLWGAFPR